MATHPLKAWLDRHALSLAAFGRVIGRSRSTLHRYTEEGRVPDLATMRLIYIETGGAVEPNGFYPLADWDREIAGRSVAESAGSADNTGEGEAA